MLFTFTMGFLHPRAKLKPLCSVSCFLKTHTHAVCVSKKEGNGALTREGLTAGYRIAEKTKKYLPVAVCTPLLNLVA